MSHNITVQGGKSVRLLTAGKYCDRDIVITAVNGENTSADFLGEKMYTFGALSDIHLGYEDRNATADFHRAITALQNLGVDFVGISGDVGYYSDTSSVITELQGYKDALDNYATVPFYTVTGNHDIKHPDDVWEQYTGHPKNFEIVHNGDVFLFMSLTQKDKASSHDTPYTTSLTWLKEKLSRYQGARIFVFMHYPISNYSGLRDGEYYGFSSASTEDDELLSTLLSTKNVVVFSGHTHFKLDCEADYDTINVFNFQHKKVSLVHIPSCAYPRDSAKKEQEQLSEGYVVEVYEKGVILRGVDLVTGDYMPNYEYAFMIDNNPDVANSSAIVLSTNEISLSAKESAEIEVSLTDPIRKTITISASNDYITVSPTSFTLDEDKISQTITITAGELETSESVLITVNADGLTPRTISVSLTHEEPEEIIVAISGTMTPVNGTIYGGVCGGGVYTAVNQLKSASSGTYNFTFRNLMVTSSETPVYMSAGGSTTTINLEGINTLDTSGVAKLTQRAISSSGTNGNYLIGVGEGAELILKGKTTATTELIKGDWTIENAKVTGIGTTVSGQVLVEVISKGITLRKSGAFSLNGTGVELVACENGYIEVNLGSATAGTSAITIKAYPDAGYTYTGITSAVMPASGETLTIQGVFTK